MKAYDVIAIGTGSAMNIVDGMMQRNPDTTAAVIDKDEPGGICLTRGCIPSKILLYPAELVRTIQRAGTFGIDVDLREVDFGKVMARMRTLVGADVDAIRQGLTESPNIDYFQDEARFVSPYTLEVAGETVRSDTILLCTGSQPSIPPIEGLEEVGYHTSDTILGIDTLPPSVAIVGGGYIAAEYGHFLSAMGADVTIVGRNPQFLPEEEPEVSSLAKREMGKRMTVLTNTEVREARLDGGEKVLVARDRGTDEAREITADEVLVAAGRGPTTEVLEPSKGGVETDARGWIRVNERLETSMPGVYAMGDALGRHQFKHVANHESLVVYYNAVLGQDLEVDYHAVPHAVFTDPEVAGVGLGEREAIERHGEDHVRIGFERYQDTAKGEAMAVEDYFVKSIVEASSYRILGAHIIGPHASVLIQEVVNLMYTPEQTAQPIFNGMHIHPALTEVVERAFGGFAKPSHYHHTLREFGLAPS